MLHSRCHPCLLVAVLALQLVKADGRLVSHILLLLLFRYHKWTGGVANVLAVRRLLLLVVRAHVHLILNEQLLLKCGCSLVCVAVMDGRLCAHVVRVALGGSEAVLTARFYHTLDVFVYGCRRPNIYLLVLVSKYVVIAMSKGGGGVIARDSYHLVVVSVDLRHLASLEDYLANLVLSLFNPRPDEVLLRWLDSLSS